MKNKKRSYKWPVFIAVLIVGIILIAGAFFYTFDITPKKSSVPISVTPVKVKVGCQRVWSLSQEKFVEQCDTRQSALKVCAEQFAKLLKSEIMKELKDISELDELREFSMKFCMEGKGYEY